MDLALTKGMGNPFDILTLERIEGQTKEFSKPVISGLSLIPLAIIALFLYSRTVRK